MPAPLASIESFPDPDRPGRTLHRIRGGSREAVQGAIDQLSGLVDVAFDGVPGTAFFVGPTRFEGGYAALGETIVFQA